MYNETPTSRAACIQLDEIDPLAHWRDQFELPNHVTYLDGNSLGAQPWVAREATEQVMRDWSSGLVGSWNSAGWFEAPRRLGKKVANLIGAKPDEVVVTDSMSVNLFKLLVAAIRLRPERTVVLCESRSFPSDRYIAESAAGMFPHVCCQHVTANDIESQIDQHTAAVYLAHVDYKSSHMHDMERINRCAHDCGATVIWNLAHSAGAMPLELSKLATDFAVGCGYKYLNGGPGAPSFVYVARRLQQDLQQPLPGWFSHLEPFAFSDQYRPANGVQRLLCGTPPIVSMSTLEAAVDLWQRVDLTQVRAKSVAMTSLFIEQAVPRGAAYGLELSTPLDPRQRGSHVSFIHQFGHSIMQALIDRNVIGDFRAPNLIRFGMTPLYLRFVEVWDAIDKLIEILDTEVWRDPKYRRQDRPVT